MKFRALPASILMILLVCSACSSSSRLSQYPLKGKKVAFLSRAECDDVDASVWVNDPAPWAGSPWTSFASWIVSLFGSAAADATFDGAVDTGGAARVLSDGIQRQLVDRCGVVPAEPTDPGLDFTLATRLRDIDIDSNPDGVFLRVKVTEELYSARDSSLVWERTLRQELPLRNHSSGIWDPTVMAVEGVVSAVELLSMEQEEVQSAVLFTAEDTGLALGEMIAREAR